MFVSFARGLWHRCAVEPNPERFLALLRRELGAVSARLLAAGSPVPHTANTLTHVLGDGRVVVAAFVDTPDDATVLAQRLAVLADTFEDSVRGLSMHSARLSVSRSLDDELAALATRAMAEDALVIDADSPVLWGSAHGEAQRTPAPEFSTAMLVRDDAPSDWSDDASGEHPALPTENVPPPRRSQAKLELVATPAEQETEPLPPDDRHARVERALEHVRALEHTASLGRGKPLVHHFVGDGFALAAHSFASIYLVVLVYETSFDELRAERAIAEALPRIAELVSALPPLDPEPAPLAGVVRLPRRRRSS